MSSDEWKVARARVLLVLSRPPLRPRRALDEIWPEIKPMGTKMLWRTVASLQLDHLLLPAETEGHQLGFKITQRGITYLADLINELAAAGYRELAAIPRPSSPQSTVPTQNRPRQPGLPTRRPGQELGPLRLSAAQQRSTWFTAGEL